MTDRDILSQENGAGFAEWSTRRIQAALFVLGFGLALFLGYFALPVMVRNISCPAGTFMSGPLGEQTESFVAVFIPVACLILLFCLAPETRRPIAAVSTIKRHLVVFAAIACCTLLAAAAVLTDVTFSFFCATPTAILLHRGVVKSYQRHSWSDVKTVRAYCWNSARLGRSNGIGSYMGHGSLKLTLSDGSEFVLNLGSGQYTAGQQNALHDSELIRRALAGDAYRYEFPDISLCPARIYDLFVTWRS